MLVFKFLGLLFMAATSLASHKHRAPAERRQGSGVATATSSIDYAKISGLLNSYAGDMSVSALVPSPTVTLGISIPPSLKNEIMTAVPPSVVIQLVMNTEYRASLASDFAGGSPPTWYDKLKPEVKTFFQDMAESIKTGDAVVTKTSTPQATEATGDATAEGGGEPETSTSEDLAKPTGVDSNLVAGVVGVAGVLGVALAL